MDVCGPMRHASKGGARFLLVMLDDATRMSWTRLLKAKGDVTKVIQEWVLEVCDDDKKRIKAIRTDGGGEFVNAELEKWMKSKGIKHDVTTPYTPQQNGAAERLDRTLVEAVRSLLQHSKLGSEWWGEASSLAAWIRNRLPTKVLPGTTPFEAWSGTKPNLSRLRTFGCLCYYHVPDPLCHKLQPKACVAIYSGIVANERVWRVWDLGERRVVTSRDVVFDEDKFPTKEQPTPQLSVILLAREEDEPMEQRTRRPNKKYTDYAMVAVGDLDEESAAYCFTTLGDDPRTHTEALASPDAPLWKQAMEKELALIKENDVFELVDPPKSAYSVGCTWVLKKKLRADGSVERYKARLVAQGYTQWEGEYYSETFAPIAKATTLRVLLALVASLNLEVEQLDVCTAFLYGLLMEEVYMRQPPGYDDGSGRVWKLKRTLYGLKQSPRGWYKCIDDFLLQHGFARSECDSALYVLKEGEKQLVLLLYVDDLLLFSDSKDLIREVKQRLGAELAMRDLGPVTYDLGMHVDHDRANGTIHLHQEKYVKGVVESFGMGNSKMVGTPLATGFSCLTTSSRGARRKAARARQRVHEGYRDRWQDDPCMQLGDVVTSAVGLAFEFRAHEMEGPFAVDYYLVTIGGPVALDLRLRIAHPKLQTPSDVEVHLNVGIAELEHTNDIHGVLGQTYRDDHSQRAADFQRLIAMLQHPISADGPEGEGFLDGTPRSYEASSVLAVDCAYTAFDRAQYVMPVERFP
ncbi:unnamed protein product [Closterium sp. NIES-53]